MTAEPRAEKLESPGPSTWNCADETPEPESAELDETVIVPRTAAPSAGAVSAPLGEVLSRVTVRAALVVWLPATSVVSTRSW